MREVNAAIEHVRRQPGAAFEIAQIGTRPAHHAATPELWLAGSARTRAAPFRREIEAKLAATGTADIRLYAGDPAGRWARALERRALVGPATATLLPPGDDPLALRWPACPVVADVTGLDGVTVRKLAEALVRDGAPLAYLIDTRDAARSIRLLAETAREAT